MNIAPFQSVQELTDQLKICNFSWLHYTTEEQQAYAEKVEAFFLSQLHNGKAFADTHTEGFGAHFTKFMNAAANCKIDHQKIIAIAALFFKVTKEDMDSLKTPVYVICDREHSHWTYHTSLYSHFREAICDNVYEFPVQPIVIELLHKCLHNGEFPKDHVKDITPEEIEIIGKYDHELANSIRELQGN